MAYGYSKNKSEKPKRGPRSNNMGGGNLNQPGAGGGKKPMYDSGSLDQPGFGGGKGADYGKGFGNKPIPKSEQ